MDNKASKALLGFVALAVLLRWTVRDRWPYLATIYYATPPAVLAALLAASAWRLERKRLLLALAALALGWQATASIHLNIPTGAPTHRVACWNAGRHASIPTALLDVDVLALTEAAHLDHVRHSHDLGGGLRLVTRAAVRSTTLHRLDGRYGKLALATLTLRGTTLRVAVVDLSARPSRPRNGQVAAMLAYIDRFGPHVILGDFNLPRGSALLDPLRARRYLHAFEHAGRGWAETWPIPVPVLCLDQIWCAPGVHPARCVHRWDLASDHRPVVAGIAIR